MKTLVFTAGFYDRDFDEKLYRLKKSCEIFNIDLHVYGNDKSVFNFYDSKIVKMGVYLDQFKDKYSHVLYIDASDCFFLSGLDEIEMKYKNLGEPDLIVSGEKSCHPYPELIPIFKGEKPWRFMNPGMFLGKIDTVLNTISALKVYYYLTGVNDQGHWMKAYNDFRIRPEIDVDCLLFQTMSEAEFETEFELGQRRLKNKITHTYPSVVHFNGPKDAIYEERSAKVFNLLVQ